MTDPAWIRSTIDPATGKAACLFQWGKILTLITPEAVLTTARDLMAAAAHAEADIALLDWCRDELKVDAHTASHMVLDIRARRPVPTGRSALRIEAVAGVETRKPYVHIGRGSMKGQLSPDEAREVASHWTQAALAAQIDVRLRYVLGEDSDLTGPQTERIFQRLQELQR